jgi:hypothetical protein
MASDCLPLIASDCLLKADVEAPLHAAWSDYLPASHLSTAAVIVLFKLADRKSYEEAKRFCDEATKLSRVQVIAFDCHLIAI